MRSCGKKGFTLVEIIVVLVILAILAAVLIPSMTGWVRKAEQRVIVADARNVYLAATASVVEQYALNKTAFAASSTKFAGGKRGRVTDFNLKRMQDSGSSATDCDQAISALILEYLSSTDRNTADYKFLSEHNPLGIEVKTYHDTYKQPGVIVSYTPEGKIDFIEFGYKTTLVHINGASGALTITENGRYSRGPN